MPSLSFYKQLTLPTVGGDTGIWGTELNTTINTIDNIVAGAVQINSSISGTNVTLSSSQAQCLRINVVNDSGGLMQLNIPASNAGYGLYYITNGGTTAQPLTVTAGSSGTGGSNALIGAGENRLILMDGADAIYGDYQFASIVAAADGGTIAPTSGERIRLTTPFPFQLQQYTCNSDQSSASGTWSILCFCSTSPGGQSLSVNPVISGGSNSAVMSDYIPRLSTLIFTLNSPANFTKGTCNLIGYKT